MSAMVDRRPEANTLYIGEGVTIKSAVVVCTTVVVEGVLEGDIDVDNLFVRAAGTISGRIKVAQNAEIAGNVLDRLDVKGLLILRAGGRVNGSISFGTLTIERGATITGEVSSTDYRTNLQSSYRANTQPSAPTPKQDVRPADAAAALTRTRLEPSALDEMPGPIAATA
jgi:cytoskeletal protein CcmA (bactofilin family)